MTAKTPDPRPETNQRRAVPPPSSEPPVEPAQGTVDTETRYRDRPTDDGKYGDAAETSATPAAPVRTTAPLATPSPADAHEPETPAPPPPR
jgi:hypothetical protein